MFEAEIQRSGDDMGVASKFAQEEVQNQGNK
jgi:hypothetical protein